MLLALPNDHFHREAKEMHNRCFEVLSHEQVQYDDCRAKKAHSGANIPSDIAVTVNINAEFNLSLT
jgi:hypothetical protein